MDYKSKIDPELHRIAKRIPYNRFIIRCANIFLPIALHFTPVPKDITQRKIALKGYNGLKFNTDIFEPSGAEKKLPCLIYIHGGAFSYKASVHHKRLACIYANSAGCKVFFPDYHLTPQYPYPAAYEDVLALYRYIESHAEELGVEKAKIGLAGDSAGAAIAALLCARYEQESLERPCLQMLVYPLTDIEMSTDSMKKFSDTPLWNAKSNRRALSYYCKNLKAEDACSAFPMQSSLPRLIPDAYIETAEYDCLHDEGVLYGAKLSKAGAKVEINETAGTFHGYDSALHTNIASSSIQKRILFLKKGFG